MWKLTLRFAAPPSPRLLRWMLRLYCDPEAPEGMTLKLEEVKDP